MTILIKLLLLLSSCSIKKKIPDASIVGFYRFLLEIQRQNFYNGLKQEKKFKESNIKQRYLEWSRTRKTYVIRLEHLQVTVRTNTTRGLLCVHRSQGCGRTEEPSPHGCLLQLITQQAVSVRGDQATTWDATKDPEVQ